MQGQRIQEAQAVFDAVVELPPDARDWVLTDRCQDDERLRSFVKRLLAEHDADTTALLKTPVYGSLMDIGEAADVPIPTQIGGYSILRVIGEGGMGVVYLAEQHEPFHRQVALKVLKQGADHRHLVARFASERQALALMNHPHIAKVFDAGVMSDGCPYFVMEFVSGSPITDFCEARRLGVRERLELIAYLCDAIQHAHQKGIIHRDLKPGNILVDESGQPKILDFGVARLTDSDTQAVTLQTTAGQLIGTVPYMSPEQVTGVSANVDTRSDVYALGVICFRLLTGFLPYDVKGHSIPEVARIIAEQEPSRLGNIDTLYRGDLETIVSKALAKDKARRYQSASDFAADIRRYLDQRPISARPPTAFYQLRMFARRNKTLVGGILATILTLVVGIAATSIQTVRVTRERNAAQRAEQLAQQRAYVANVAAAFAAIRSNDVATARQQLEAAPPAMRQWEWRHLAFQLDASSYQLFGHEYYVWSSVFFDEGKRLASSSADGTVRIWDWQRAKLLQTIDVGSDSVRRVTVSPDGRFLATAAEEGAVDLWDSESAAHLGKLIGHKVRAMDVAFSPDGRLVATASYDHTARVWDAATGAPLLIFEHPHWLHQVRFSADSKRIVTSCRDNIARIWDLDSQELVCAVEAAPPTPDNDHVHSWAVALDPHGRRLATGNHEGLIKLWDIDSGLLEHVLLGHEGRVRALSYSPDGLRLASASDDRTVRLWAPAQELELATLLGHTGGVFDVQFSSDGRRLATGSSDNSVRVWDVPAGGEKRQIGTPFNYGTAALAATPDGQTLLGGGMDGTVRAWNVETATETGIAARLSDAIYTLALSADGRWAAAGARDGSVRAWELSGTGTPVDFSGHEDGVRGIAFLPTGGQLASAAEDGVVHIWALSQEEPLRTLHSGTRSFQALACRPDEAELVTGSEAGLLEFWDVATGQRVRAVAAHSDRIRCLAFRQSGDVLVSTSDDATVKLWDAQTGMLKATWRGHTAPVSYASFAPNGARVATVSFDRSLKIWDPASGQALLSFQAHQDWPWAVVFSPDGSWMASSSRSIRIWRAISPLASEGAVGMLEDASSPNTGSADHP